MRKIKIIGVGAVAASLLFGILTPTAAYAADPPAPTTGVNKGVTAEEVRQRILDDTNAYRAAEGLHPLKLSTKITEVAQTWSEQQAYDHRMYHNPRFSSQMPKNWRLAGENVAVGYGYGYVTRAWFNSPDHNWNLMNKSYTYIGIGVAYTFEGQAYYTQNFGSYVSDPDVVTPPPGNGGGTTPPVDNGGGTTPPVDNGGGTTPPVDNDGGTTPPVDNGGGTTPPVDNGGGTTPPVDNGGGTTPPVDNGARVNSRLAGEDRYQTALAILKQYKSYETVYVASGENFPDALSVTGVAGREGNPVVITTRTGMPNTLLNEIKADKPKKIVIIGSAASVSDNVVRQLRSAVPSATVSRIAGADRYETGEMIAEKLWTGKMDTIYMTTGFNFPDALAAAPAAIKNKGMVLPVHGSRPDAQLLVLLKAKGVKNVVVVGGAGNIPASFESTLRNQGYNVKRIAGGDRYETSNLIAKDSFSGTQSKAYVATGINFADALSIASLAGSQGAPLLLSTPSCIPKSNADYVKNAKVKDFIAVGSTPSLSDAVLKNLRTC